MTLATYPAGRPAAGVTSSTSSVTLPPAGRPGAVWTVVSHDPAPERLGAQVMVPAKSASLAAGSAPAARSAAVSVPSATLSPVTEPFASSDVPTAAAPISLLRTALAAILPAVTAESPRSPLVTCRSTIVVLVTLLAVSAAAVTDPGCSCAAPTEPSRSCAVPTERAGVFASDLRAAVDSSRTPSDRSLTCLAVIEFFLIREPLMSLAASAGPPSATNRATMAMTVAGEGRRRRDGSFMPRTTHDAARPCATITIPACAGRQVPSHG